MKKLFLMAVMAVVVSVASAQDNKMWIGGTLKSQSDETDGNKVSEFVFGPEFGYNLNDKWAIGAGINFMSGEDEGDDTDYSATFFSPFARYTFARSGKFDFYLNGALTFGSYKETDHDIDATYKYNYSGFDVNPGMTFNFNQKFAVEMRLPSLLSFYSYSGDADGSGHYFGINDGYTLQNYVLDAGLAVIYKF